MKNLKKGIKNYNSLKFLKFGKLNLVSLSTFLFVQISNAQIFTPIPTSSTKLPNLTSSMMMSFVDINADGLDDLCIYDLTAEKMFVNFQNEDHSFTTKSFPHLSKNIFSLMSADFDGDRMTTLISGDGETIRTFNELNQFKLQSTQLNNTIIFSQNIALGDVNSDGLVDMFACNDVGNNRFYLNQGENKFKEDLFTVFNP
ncbi:MAG: VCBS repeat-containing protein, partial [Saprospiraceae bacterium]|nr:VCBS repeat-containing protein [Saprospiraceae bacterium]